MSQLVKIETPAGTTARDAIDKLLKAQELYGPNLEFQADSIVLVRWGVPGEIDDPSVAQKRQANK